MPLARKTKMKYKIVRGDTLSQIAKRFDVSVDEIMRENPNIKNKDKIYAGDTIEIPGGGLLKRWLARIFSW